MLETPNGLLTTTLYENEMADAQLSFFERLITDKKCSDCGLTRPSSKFYKSKDAKDGLQRKCKDCQKLYSAEYFRKNREDYKRRHKEWRDVNKEKLEASKKAIPKEKRAEYYRRSRQKNKARIARASKIWREKNLALAQGYCAARRAKRINATPAWADLAEIAKFYERAIALTAETGVKHVVDHIIPLTHKNICGLHVQSNLQVITKSENSFKCNKYPYDPETYKKVLERERNNNA